MTQTQSRYEILEQIGQGGFAIVHRARDTELDRLVALKELRPALLQDIDWVRRFKREARTIARLNHPRIVTIYDVVEVAARLFIIMHLVEGAGLDKVLAGQGRLSWLEAVEIFTALAEGLDFAHSEGILHRDLKPANILIDDRRGPLLTDFGLAKLVTDAGTSVTAAGGIVGTPHYISPEIWEGQGSSRQSDIYALGCILYEMLTGEVLFGGDSPPAAMMAHFNPPQLPKSWPEDVPPGLADVLQIALARQPGDRYATAGDMAEALRVLSTALTPQAQAVFEPPVEIQNLSSNVVKDRHNLPVQTTPFIGREAELAELARLFADPDIRLVTVLGPGGMGKTRLALELAASALDIYTHGVYFVPLAPLNAVEYLVPAITGAINYQFHADGRSSQQQLLDYLSQKQMLLILDNFEHLLDGVNLVNDLLQAAPGVRILITSRERLKLSAETIFSLSGMTFPKTTPGDLSETPDDARHYHAVKLFMQSAQRVRPDFELKAEALQSIAQICRLVQGMPLGIVLAAAWIEMLSPAEIASEIEQSLDFLETELRDIPERQHSIRAIFESSWQRLTEVERDAFMRLSIFRAGFTRQAAQEVATANDGSAATLRLLTGLVNKSLIQRTGEGRYEIHELLRQYAEAQLETSGQLNSARDAHSSYYLDLIHERETELAGPGQLTALDELEADFENIRAAWQWAIRTQNYATVDQALEGLYRWFWMRRTRQPEGQALLALARQQWAPAAGDEPHRVWGRVMARILNLDGPWLANPTEAREQIETALKIAKQHHNQAEIAFCLWALGLTIISIVPHHHHPDIALGYYEQSLALYRDLGDSFYIAQVLQDMGHCRRQAWQTEQAFDVLQQSLRLKQDIGDKIGVGHCLRELGWATYFAGNAADTERYWQAAHRIRQDVEDRPGIADSIFLLSLLAVTQGNWERGHSLAGEVMAIAQDIDSRLYKGWAKQILTITACMKAAEDAGQDPVQTETIHPPAFEFEVTLMNLIFSARGETMTYRKYLPGALRTDNPVNKLRCLPFAAWLVAQQGESERAVMLLGLACSRPEFTANWVARLPQVSQLRADLEASLPAERFATAWERGQALDLNETTEQLAVELLEAE